MLYQLSRPALNSARKKTSEHWLQVHVRAALSFPYRGGTSASIWRDSLEIRLCCVFDCITFVIFKSCEEKSTGLLPCTVTLHSEKVCFHWKLFLLFTQNLEFDIKF